MKVFFTLAFLFTALFASAQTQSVPAPDFYLDSVKVDNAHYGYMDPDDIKSINVSRDKRFVNGAIFIEMKDHELALKIINSKPLSLEQITLANVPDYKKHKQPIIFLIDDRMLTDTANMRIAPMFVRNVKVVAAAETPYFKTALPKVLLLMISTKPPQIYIRGQAEK